MNSVTNNQTIIGNYIKILLKTIQLKKGPWVLIINNTLFFL